MINLYYEEMLYPNFQPPEVWGSHRDNDVFVFSLFSIENYRKYRDFSHFSTFTHERRPQMMLKHY